MLTRTILAAASVRRMMATGRAETERAGLAVSVAVVDEGGVPLALERLDGARLHTPEAAWLKARIAAIVRSETATLEQAVRADPALPAFPGRLPLAGGVPVMHDGAVAGGVGSSGGAPADDLTVCAAMLATLGA